MLPDPPPTSARAGRAAGSPVVARPQAGSAPGADALPAPAALEAEPRAPGVVPRLSPAQRRPGPRDPRPTLVPPGRPRRPRRVAGRPLPPRHAGQRGEGATGRTDGVHPLPRCWRAVRWRVFVAAVERLGGANRQLGLGRPAGLGVLQ